MIYIIYPETSHIASDLVYLAFCRAFSRTQVCQATLVTLPKLFSQDKEIFLVMSEPTENFLEILFSFKKNIKICFLGKLPDNLAKFLNISLFDLPKKYKKAAHCKAALPHTFSESNLFVQYHRGIGMQQSPMMRRPFLRYDFRDEWNNLGYGAIRLDHSIWALASGAHVREQTLLASVLYHQQIVSAYAALWDEASRSFLWFNRAVGPIDSQEWRLIEYFFASYRHHDLSCLPCLSEIPAGWDAAVTMRLDCDEDITSARNLFTHYQKWQVPFSLAIPTAILKDASQKKMLQEVIEDKGAILSHSHTHPVEWGGSYEQAYQEAYVSANILESIIKQKIRYAVSPFHHTPPAALAGLADAGYWGCIGGIVSSHPEFLLARGGMVFGDKNNFIGHSQSCMLHGDCLLKDQDPLAIYKEAFLIALRGRALFGFLDHPFSARYTYGWFDEEARMIAHQTLIEYLRAQGRVLFLNEIDALNFIRFKSAIQISIQENKLLFRLPTHLPIPSHAVMAEWKGASWVLSSETMVSA